MILFLHLIASTIDTGFTIDTLLKWVTSAGLIGFMMFIIYGGFRKWWVFGWVLKESDERNKKLQQERDDWRDLALHGTTIAEQTVDLFRRSRGGGEK